MGVFNFIKKWFQGKNGMKNKNSAEDCLKSVECKVEPEPEVPLSESNVVSSPEPKSEQNMTGWQGRLILSSTDLMQMARKLQNKGEYYRAEQLLRDGAKNARANSEYWWLLYEIEEPLNRKGRAYYCIEQILQLNESDLRAVERVEELKRLVDTDLSYFIEYKLAPEFYRLK